MKAALMACPALFLANTTSVQAAKVKIPVPEVEAAAERAGGFLAETLVRLFIGKLEVELRKLVTAEEELGLIPNITEYPKTGVSDCKAVSILTSPCKSSSRLRIFWIPRK